MEVKVFESPAAAVRRAADMVEVFLSRPMPVIGLATGVTMEPLYEQLVLRHRRSQLPLGGVAAYQLDEYLGLDTNDISSFRSTLLNQFVCPVGLPSEALHSPDPEAADIDAECRRYEQEVLAAKIGLQLLGIGSNGHVAFNEPGSPLDSKTRVVELSQQTRCDNAQKFPAAPVPSFAITQGVGTILNAAHLLLLAFGKGKARSIRQALEGPITPELPASAVQLHGNAIVILDAQAASLLSQ